MPAAPAAAGAIEVLRADIAALEVDAIVILEVFAKKSQSTPNEIIATCRARLGRYLAATKEE